MQKTNLWKIWKREKSRKAKNEVLDIIEKDMKQLKLENWKQIVKERQLWKRVVEEVKIHKGL